MIVEKYHCFIYKKKVIAGQERVTCDVFLQNTKTSQYAWNRAQIDGIDILRSVATVGR